MKRSTLSLFHFLLLSWNADTAAPATTKTLSDRRSLHLQKVLTGTTGGSRFFFDFGEIAISAAGERDLEGLFSL
jgi:hypothetical protein